MARQYQNPPVVEAVCEFRLKQDTPWDLTVPGIFYEKVKHSFPEKEQRLFQDIDFLQEPQGLRQQIRTSERVILYTQDRRMLIQLGPRLLVVNALKPYPSWEGFKSKIQMAWDNLLQTVSVTGLEHVGVRYINLINIPNAEKQSLGEYFAFYPYIGDALPRSLQSFIAGAEFSYEQSRDHCRVQLATAQGGGILLDIEYFLKQPDAVTVSKVMDWVDLAHSQVEEVFEGCITDKLRRLFEEVQ